MLYTAQFGYKGVDRYDITTKTGNIFSPTWDMVAKYRDTMDSDSYTHTYLKLMRESYRNRLKHKSLKGRGK